MTTRLLTPQDFSKVYALWQLVDLKLYPEALEKEKFELTLQYNPDTCLAFEENGEIIGTVMGTFDGRTAMMHRLAMHPDYQKKGLGQKLFSLGEEKLHAKGAQKIIIQVHVSNTEILPFYEKLGYQELSYAKDYFKDFE